jgi:hypothetical protein
MSTSPGQIRSAVIDRKVQKQKEKKGQRASPRAPGRGDRLGSGASVERSPGSARLGTEDVWCPASDRAK